MLLVWILLILLALVLFKYITLICKRFILLHKLKRTRPEALICKRNRFRSVFIPDGKVDFIVKSGENEYAVSVITTPFRRVRYHFDRESLQIVYERRAVNLTNHSSPRPRAATTIDNVFVLKKYKLKGDTDIPEQARRYVILHPAPKSVSAVSGTQVVTLSNNDPLCEGVRVCGLKYFVNNILGEEGRGH